MRNLENWNKRFLHRQLKTFSPRLQRDLVKYPAKDLPEYGSYYLWGTASTGKTTTAAHMYLAAAKKFYLETLPGQCIFTTVSDFLDDLQKCVNDPERDIHAVRARYIATEFLVLDDLGAEKMSEWELSQLQRLINGRYESLSTIVVTSNVSLNRLANVLGDDRIPARLKIMCKTIAVK